MMTNNFLKNVVKKSTTNRYNTKMKNYSRSWKKHKGIHFKERDGVEVFVFGKQGNYTVGVEDVDRCATVYFENIKTKREAINLGRKLKKQSISLPDACQYV